jgi:dolichyl-diphosphooligosaccharide--protein glycosyltransferase
MDRFKRYERAGLVSAVVLGLLLRLLAGRNALVGSSVLFDGYDTYYHMRRVLYTVAHFPNTVWFDSYLDYPHGMELTWPPLFDQLIAGTALAFGIHDQHGIELVASFIPVMLGAVAVLVVYYLVREVFDWKVALLSAFTLAIAPYHLLKTMFSAADHHALEALLLMAILAFLVLAITRRDRKYVFAGAAGVSMAALAYTWAGAAAYLGFFFIYALVQMVVDLRNGESSKDTTVILLTAFGLALVLMAPFWNTPWMAPSFLGTLAMVAAIALLFGLSKVLLDHKVHWAFFPMAIVILGYIYMLLPHILGQLWVFTEVDSLVRSGGEYLLGGDMVGKIAEAEPIYVRTNFISYLGVNLLYTLLGLAALVLYVVQPEMKPEKRQGSILLLVWILSTLVLTVGQIRFLYISAISTAILISVLFFRSKDAVSSKLNESGKSMPTAAIALILVLLLLPSAAEVVSIASDKPQITGDWYESLSWLKENTNATSWYDDPSKTPEYSVMGWWDYGNWIVYEAKRPVVANNFQVGVIDSAQFFLSQDESQADAIMDRRGSRYVITDFDMIYGKLAAITSWVGEDASSYEQITDFGDYVTAVPLKKLMNTALAKIHLYDGSGMGHYRLIYESSTLVGANPPTSTVKISEYVSGALITGTTEQDQPVGVLLNLTSNQGRKFQYFNIGAPNGTRYEIRVPYATEKRYDTHAVDSYLVFSGGKSVRVNVSENDVLEGRPVEVDF